MQTKLTVTAGVARIAIIPFPSALGKCSALVFRREGTRKTRVDRVVAPTTKKGSMYPPT